MTDTKLRNKYFDNVYSELHKMETMSRDKLQKVIDNAIQQRFEQVYLTRLQTMYKKSKEAQTLERRRMYNRLKRYLFKSRCIQQGNESFEKQMERLKNYSYKLPHCTESWAKSWRDQSNPLIEKSPLFQISKAIGKASISPVELTKEYLTNPAARDQLSMLTIDRDELLKLQ